jgi:hypothetical protein
MELDMSTPKRNDANLNRIPWDYSRYHTPRDVPVCTHVDDNERRNGLEDGQYTE